MERGLGLSYPQSSILILFLPYSSPLTNPSLPLSRKPNFSAHLRFSQRRWDSNAETFRTQRSKFNFRDTANEEDEDEEEDSQDMDAWSGLLEEAIDSFWIIKVKEFHCCFRICESELESAPISLDIWKFIGVHICFGLEFGSAFCGFGSRICFACWI